MSKNIIGLKQADGSFYPILERGKPAKKRLQITTSADNQTTAQLTLYCASDESFADAEYVDTLKIEGLVPHEKRAHDIDVTIGVDENDKLSVELSDKESGGTASNTVALVPAAEGAAGGGFAGAATEDSSMAENTDGFASDELPDFDSSFSFAESSVFGGGTEGGGYASADAGIASSYDDDTFDYSDFDDLNEFSLDDLDAALGDADLDFDVHNAIEGEDDPFDEDAQKTYEYLAEEADKADSMNSAMTNFDFLDPRDAKPKLPLVPLVCVVCAVISILSCFVIWLLMLNNRKETEKLVVTAQEAVSRYESVKIVAETPGQPSVRVEQTYAQEDSIIIIDAPVKIIPATPKAVVSASAEEAEGKSYLIKRGDTLWDIADTFYKNPWMYGKIARANNIKNPDFILSGTWIVIPPM